jgi:RNA polymerase sigma factor (sigma-70 family)
MRLPVWKRKPVASEVAIPARHTEWGVNQRGTFLRLIADFEPALRRLAAAYFDQSPDREDLFQEIAIALWKAIPNFRGDSTERTWLYRIAHNVAISSSARARSRGRREEWVHPGFERPSGTPNAEQQALRAEKRQQLVDSIRELQGLDRQIILLHLEDLSYAEVAHVTGLSETAVAARLSRIREKLRIAVRRKEEAQ